MPHYCSACNRESNKRLSSVVPKRTANPILTVNPIFTANPAKHSKKNDTLINKGYKEELKERQRQIELSESKQPEYKKNSIPVSIFVPLKTNEAPTVKRATSLQPRINQKLSVERNDCKIPTQTKGKEVDNFNNYGGASNQDIPKSPRISNPRVEKPLFSPNKQIKNENYSYIDPLASQNKEFKKIYNPTPPLDAAKSKIPSEDKARRDYLISSECSQEQIKKANQSHDNTKETITSDSKDLQSEKSRCDTKNSLKESKQKHSQVEEEGLINSPKSLVPLNPSKDLDQKIVPTYKSRLYNNISYFLSNPRNSVLQCLFGIECFMKKCSDNKDNSHLCQLLWKIFTCPTTNCSTYITSLQKLIPNPSFRRYQFADAHEWLRCLLEKILNEKTISKPNWIDELFDGKILTKTKCDSCSKKEEFDEGEFFEIILGSDYPANYSRSSANIGDLLSNYFKNSEFGIDLECCNKPRLTGIRSLKTAPQILVLKIDRSNLINTTITAPFKMIKKPELNNHTYQLKGMVQFRSFHYTAIVADPTGTKWNLYNDHMRTSVEESRVRDSSDSMLYFYTKEARFLQLNGSKRQNDSLPNIQDTRGRKK